MLRPPMPVHPYQEGGYGGPSTEAAAMVLQFMAAAAESGPPANVQPHSSQPPAAVRWVEHVPQVAELPSHFPLAAHPGTPTPDSPACSVRRAAAWTTFANDHDVSPAAGLAHHRQVLPLVPVTEPRGMKRRRSFSNDEEQSTHITNTIGIISRPVQIHAPVQVLQRPPSSAGSSRLDISHGGWTAVSSNATTAALDPETVVNLLRDPAFRPGARPSTFSRSLCTWVFKEGRDFHIRGKAAAGRHSDRWCANLPPGDTCSR